MVLNITIPVGRKPEPDIKIKEKPQKKRDLLLLKQEEGLKQKVYDDADAKFIPKGSSIKEDSTIVYPDGRVGGKATIGYGHKVLPNEFDTIYKPDVLVSKTDLEKQLEKDYDSKKTNIENILKSRDINLNEIPPNALSILVRNAFWGVATNFPGYFNNMIQGNYVSAAENLQYYDPENRQKGFTAIYGNENLRPRTERSMEEILDLIRQ